MLNIYLPTTFQAIAEVFYGTYFGFVRKTQHEAVLWMEDSAGQILGLEEVESVQHFPARFKLGFRLPSIEEVQSLRRALIDSGHVVEPASPLLLEEDASFFVRDPDGRRILVFSRAP